MSYSPIARITPTPHQKRRSDNPHRQLPVVKEATHVCADDYDDRAICPMCHLPMHVCDGHLDMTEEQLRADYIKQNKQSAPYEMTRRMFASEQMAALSPEAARFAKMKVERE